MTHEITLEPGSLEAISKGCTCLPDPDAPSIDGSRPLDWECPLHGIAAVQHALLDAEPQHNERGEQMKLNSGEPWSEIDDNDLTWCLEHNQDIDEIADFLCRTPSEIRARMAQRGLTRKLVRI